MRRRPILLALLAHFAAILVTVATAQIAGRGFDMLVPPLLLAAVQGGTAAAIGYRLGLDRWWLAINAGIPFAVLGGLRLDLPAWVYLAGFVATMLVFWNAGGDRVPLYLTNARTWRALARLLPERRGFSFIDLGCGLGGTLPALKRARPDSRFFGVETAPIPFFIAWSRVGRDGKVNFQSLWDVDLSAFDVVYCFLSPEPMPDLFAKAKDEMNPGTLFVSNSFAVPGHEPDEVIEVGDRRQTRLLVWRM